MVNPAEYGDTEAVSKETVSCIIPTNPFRDQALDEAVDDALVGIVRSDDWVRGRANELFEQNELQVHTSDGEAHGEYFRKENLIQVFDAAMTGRYGKELKKEALSYEKKWLGEKATNIEQAIAADRLTRPVPDTVQQLVDARTSEIKRALEKEAVEERYQTILTTITVVKSWVFCILIPIIGMLPEPWNKFSPLPLIAVIYLNYKPVMKLRAMMKELNKKSVETERLEQ